MEQKKEYIYTMPQAFMDDKSVPTHWRLLGYLNGFFINGKSVWASSATIAEELGVSERSIRTAVNTLENLEFIFVERTKTSRVIQPFARKPISDEVGNELPQGRKRTSAEVGNELPTNSDSLIQKDNSVISTKVDIEQMPVRELIVVSEKTEFENLLIEFKRSRSKLRRPMTDKAMELLLKKLSGYSEQEQVAMLEEAIEKGWQSVYPKKEQEVKGKNLNRMQAMANYNIT